MALIPRPTGYLENPLNQSLLGNQKEIAVVTTTDSDETNTNQIALLAGSLQTAIAVSTDLELTSPAKLKFQTDAIVRIGVGKNLIVDGIPVAGSAPTNVLYYDIANQRITYGAAPSSGSAWSTIPVVAPANMEMNNNDMDNANQFSFKTSLSATQITTGAYRALCTTSANIVTGTDYFMEILPTNIYCRAIAPFSQIKFNGRVSLPGIGPTATTIVNYKPTGIEYEVLIAYTAASVNTVSNLQGLANSVFVQTGTNTTRPVTATVGETYLTFDSQNRAQWLVQNPQQYNVNDMFPANTQTTITAGATLTGKYRTTVMGGDGLIYFTPTNITPGFNAIGASLDPSTDVVTLNAYSIAASNSSPRYCITAGNKIYHIPLSAVNGANPFYFPIYDTITKTIDNSTVLAPWTNGSGSICGALNSTERFIYMPPFAELAGAGQRVRKFDTITNTTIEIGSSYPTATYQNNKWGTACLAPNGKIYCFPFNARTGGVPNVAVVLIIDPVTDTTSLVSLTGVTAGSTMYYSSCLSPDGNFIYVSPITAVSVLKYNWRTDTFSEPAGLAVGAFGGAKYGGLSAAPNGYIYMFPQDATDIKVIDPATDTFVASIPTTNSAILAKYGDSCLAPNGKIYCAPFSANDGVGNAIAAVVKTGIPQIPAWMSGPGVNQQ